MERVYGALTAVLLCSETYSASNARFPCFLSLIPCKKLWKTIEAANPLAEYKVGTTEIFDIKSKFGITLEREVNII